MQITLTGKIHIYPSAVQAESLEKTMSAYRDGANYVSAYIYRTHDTSARSVQKAVYNDLRTQFGLSADMACVVCRDVVGKYKANESAGRKWTHVFLSSVTAVCHGIDPIHL